MGKELSAKQREELFKTLKARFEKNTKRHKGIEWSKVQAKLESTKKLWSFKLIMKKCFSRLINR